MSEHFGELYEAFVRIRPDLAGFRSEAEAGIRSSLRGAGQLRIPGLEPAERQLKGLGAAARQSGQEQVSALRQVRSAREQEARSTIAASLRERRSLEEQLAAQRQVAASAVQGSRTQVEANQLAARSAERLGIVTRETANVAVAASVREERALREQLVLYRQIGAQSARGSAEQVAANRLAARSAEQLGLELTHVERRALSAGSALNRVERGAIAGSGAFRNLGRSVAFSSLTFIGAYGFVGAVRGAIDEAGDLNNQIVRSDTVFRASSGSVRKWARDVGPALGFARESTLEAANAFGTMLSAMGLGSKQAAVFSEDITRVAAAISLARGEADPERATAALRVALAGRGRALRQYGIILDDTSIKAKAAELGLVKTTVDPGKLTLAQRKLSEAVVQLNEARAKGTPLQIARAEDAVTVAQQKLRKELAGTTGEVTKQAKAIAAHAIIMEQGEHFIDRYGASLQTAAGRSRRFHEGVSEIKEELGNALYPSFVQAADGISSYVRSLGEGGARHEQFQRDLHDAAEAAHAFYFSLRLVGGAVQTLAHDVGGFGNLVEILGFAYLANQALKFASAVRTSRLALLLLGEQATATATVVTTAEARMALGMNAGIGKAAAMTGAIARLRAAGLAGITVFVTYEILKNIARDKVPAGEQGGGGITGALLGAAKDTAGVFTAGQIPGLPFPTAPRSREDEERAKRKTLPQAIARARYLRHENFGEDAIYRILRSEGFSRALASAAIVQSREHPGGTIPAPSPEDVRIEPGAVRTTTGKGTAAARGAGGDTVLARKQVKSELGALAKEIESGEQITTARAKKLTASLSQVLVEISDAGFSPASRRRLTGRVETLATELADAAAGIGTGAVAALRKDKAEIRKELDDIGREIAAARADMTTAISDAVKGAAQAERDAVLQAKSNLNSLGQSLADFINRFVDAQQERSEKAPTGPLAARLKRLTELIHAGKATPELIAEAKKVEHELNEQSRLHSDDSEKRKERINRGLADLTDQLNTGKIGIAKFNREVTALLRREGVNYRSAGRSLGISFADGFRVALKELREQAAALVATPARLRRQGTGFETQIVRPLQVLREQNANIARVTAEQQSRLRDLIARRHELLLKEQSKANEIAKAQRQRLIELAKIRAAARPPRAPQRRPDRATPDRQAPRRRDRAPSPEDNRPGIPRRTERQRREEAALHVKVLDGEARRTFRILRTFFGKPIAVEVHTDRSQARRELGYLSGLVSRSRLEARVHVQRDPVSAARALAVARADGHGIGAALSDGIGAGLGSRIRHLAEDAVDVVHSIVRAAKKAAKIGSPSQLTYDEIGLPLGQGIEQAVSGIGRRLGDELEAQIREAVGRGRQAVRAEDRPERPRPVEREARERRPVPRPEIPGPRLSPVAELKLERVGERLGDVLAGEIRRLALRGQREATERQRAGERFVPPPLREAIPRGERQARPGPVRPRPEAVAVGPPLRTAEPSPRERLLERGTDPTAAAQRSLLLGEERKHTALLRLIEANQRRELVVLRELKRGGGLPQRPDLHKNPQVASREAVATGRNNLLGS